MRVLLVDTDQEFLQTLTTAGQADYILASAPQEALEAGAINIAVISCDMSQWEALAQHYVSQSTLTFIITSNISDISTWKKSNELGCKGVWAKDNALNELAQKLSGNIITSGNSNRRPLRGPLQRTSPKQTILTKEPNNHPQIKGNPVMPRHSKMSAIVVKRELICFFGVNGGVSKTTLSINTGVALAKQGQSVVLVDFDVFSGDVVTRLKIKPTTTMIDSVKGHIDHISKCLIDHPSGLKILAAPLNHEEGSLITPEESAKILSSLTRLFDVVIVDTAPLLIAPTLVTMEHATKVYILSPPDAATVAKTSAVLRRMEMIDYERSKYKLLVTKMPKKTPLRVNDMLSILNLELAGIIPYDEGVQIESNVGTPPVLSRRAKHFSKAVHALCNTIIPTHQDTTSRFNFLNFFKRRTGGMA